MTTTPLTNPTTSTSTQVTTVLTVAKIASGRTQPGATNWQKSNDYVYVDVDTSAAAFAKTPVYVTSIGGDNEHYATTGASSVYSATATGFRIFIRWDKGYKDTAITPEEANGNKWHINWIAIEPFSGLGLGDGTQSSSTTTALPTPGKDYYLIAKHSGKTLAVVGDSTADGANVVQWAKLTKDNHKWRLEDAGNGYFYLIAKHSGKALAVTGASTADGGNVLQWSNEKLDHFKWKLEDAGDGYFYLIAKHSGKALQVNGGNQQDGANVDQWTKQDVPHHKWKFEAV